MKYWLPIVLILLIIPAVTISRADELDDTTNLLSQKQQQLKDAQSALKLAQSKESQLTGTLGGLQNSLNVAIAEINVKQAQIDANLAQIDQQTALLNQRQSARQERIRSLYMQLQQNKASPFLALLNASDFQTMARLLDYHQSALNDDKSNIITLDNQLAQLNQQRNQLEADAKTLAAQKAQLQKQADTIKSQIYIVQSQKQGANNQIISLGNDIKGLTAKQQALVQQKLAALAASTTVGNTATISTPLPKPSFSNAFAFASYGYPHRVGMNQYGAQGRAAAGQDYQTILHAYYGGVTVGSYSEPDTINVDGYGTISLEDNYLKGISEMPRSWNVEALKAQAVAARTYAIKWVQDHPGQAICTTQDCQVYDGGRINGTGSDDQRWYQAIQATRGIVITIGGTPINAWFSSTDGGYTQSSAQVWGGATSYTQVTKDYSGSWPSGAYDKDSPWFHKAWGSRDSGYNPWLTKAETIDIFNAVLLYHETGKTADSDFDLSPASAGGSSPDQIVAALTARNIQPIGDFQLITAGQNDSTGQTDTINIIGGPRSSTTLPGADVKKIFNLHSLGTLGLMSTLFDVIQQ